MIRIVLFGTVACTVLASTVSLIADEPEVTPTVNGADQQVPSEGIRVLRLITMYELGRIHAKSLQPDDPFAPLRDDLYEQLRLEARIDAQWVARIVFSPDKQFGNHTARANAATKASGNTGKTMLTDFEKLALKKIGAGAEEVAERAPSGQFLYMRPIHVRDRCVVCHSDEAHQPGLPLPVHNSSNVIDGARISVQFTVGKQLDRPGVEIETP